jgi:hypothetical protein
VSTRSSGATTPSRRRTFGRCSATSGRHGERSRAGPSRTASRSISWARVSPCPGESPHDSIWLLGDDNRIVFLGDQVYDHKHSYLADGFCEQWLANIQRLEDDLPGDATLYIGHGGPANPALFAWQRAYIETFLDAVRTGDWSDRQAAKAAVVAHMTRFLPTDELQFLMELSIEPIAGKLGLLVGA